MTAVSTIINKSKWKWN